jgi:hypothetical protein
MMSDPSKPITLRSLPDSHAGGAGPVLAGNGAAPDPQVRGDETVRLVENCIVAVVTLLSAGVILATLLAHRDGRSSAGSLGKTTIDAAAVRR